MSYEGYTEFICKAGHYYVLDCSEPIRSPCPQCKQRAQFTHQVDMTNGYAEKGDRGCYTKDAPKKLIGEFDIPTEDHRGNKYMLIEQRWAPNHKAWVGVGGVRG